jgi:hypothetical protein
MLVVDIFGIRALDEWQPAQEAEDRNVEDARGAGRRVLDALRRKWSRR